MTALLFYEYDMDAKFGAQWIADRKICSFVALQQNAKNEMSDDAVLMWHGAPDNELVEFLKNNSQVWVLFVGTGPAPRSWLEKIPYGESRGHVLTYGIRNIGSRRNQAREQQQPWIRRRFEEFVKAAIAQKSGVPPWHLLDPPSAPEHVIACYLCTLTGQAPQSSWAEGFTEEVIYWGRKHTEKSTVPLLDWDRNKADRTALRAFLTAVGAVESAAESWAANGLD